MPIKRINGKLKAPNDAFPNISFEDSRFLPFEQRGYVLDNTPQKPILNDRAIEARYLRRTQEKQYLVLIVATNKTRLVRQEKFILEGKPNVDDNKQQVPSDTHRPMIENQEACTNWVMHPSNRF
eukprot:Plantae.Rhodophyta-Palmaria_palmata.ctg2169.p1 GENE.Plantae.Rhodophyta-Palmaria_palmata.ctg2169~~Plantae.Rhodophyta-Palmaria_palmata.ctg2169.p1  ORF type:complete len:124 (+),score=2.30 Plantae.Rhodophyta-Palmaria_palmata.ctg2169:736-1107(+)